MNIVLFHPDELSRDGEARLVDHRASHLVRILRVEPGATVRAGVLDGPLGTARVMEVGPGDSVRLRLDLEASIPPRPAVDLLLALPRPKVLKRLYAPLAALGVDRLLLTNAEKVERMYFDSHVLEPAFYEPRLIEGLQQARDTQLPRVSVHRRLKPLVEDDLDALCPDSLRLLADPAAPARLADRLPASGADRRLLLAVGPEGGWTPYEIDLLAAHGFQPFSIGLRILRSDTAVIALLALAHEMRSGPGCRPRNEP